MLEKKTNLTWKIGFENIGELETPSTPSNTPMMRRNDYSTTSGQVKPISHLPGLNPDCEYIARHQQKEFRNFNYHNRSDYVKLCREGRRGLLHYISTPVVENSSRPTSLSLGGTKMMRYKTSHRVEEEVPLIDQILSKRGEPTKCRSELQPVDNKAKLYFAYNRSSGAITRVIATSPRPFKFGKK